MTLLPEICTPIPGPCSRAWAERLQRVECPDTTAIGDDWPIFWERAAGANVWDADGNRYVDLTAAFGVALLGHGHPSVVEAIRSQAAKLVHGMGDVHPTDLKVQLGEALAAIAPGDLEVSLFGCTGSDAVEAAWKTAAIVTGRTGCVAFEGAYHGLALGALAATHRRDFRAPFEPALNPDVRFVPYPALGPRRDAPAASEAAAWRALESVDAHLGSAAGRRCGAVLVEPIQGRGGIVVPHPDFLPGLREICTRRGTLLVVDEILTGLGRTGHWFECERAGVVPDLLCVGKGLGGGLPISAAIGSRAVMDAWGVSTGEARHTSTFLGNPLACAAAVAMLEALRREDGPGLSARLGAELATALEPLASIAGVHEVRGIGSLWGIELVDAHGEADAARAFDVVRHCLQRGVLVLADGSERNVLALMPPFVLDRAQREAAVGVLRQALLETAPHGSS